MAQPRHVLFDLGYQELARVVCGAPDNRKEAIFFGGHDNVDIYVQCLCSKCQQLPPVSSDDGGSIFNCCQWEKHADLGHRKKWKESVRQADNGRRILDLLKERSAALGGEAMVGTCVWVCWPRESTFYQGIVRAWDAKDGKYHVQYADGDEEKLYLGIELYTSKGNSLPAWASRLPPPPPASASHDAPPAKRARMGTAPQPRQHAVAVEAASEIPALDGDLTAPGALPTMKRPPGLCLPGQDGEVSAYAKLALQARAAGRPARSGFDVLNLDSLLKQYPQMQPNVLRWDILRWFGMKPEEQAAHVAEHCTLSEVPERAAGDPNKRSLPQMRAFVTKPLYRSDLLGELPGVLRSAGEVAAERGGLPERVRVYEATTRGQQRFAQELCLDARNSASALARIKLVPFACKAQANVVVAEVEHHERGGSLHQILFVLDDVQPGTQLVGVSNRSWVMGDRPLPTAPVPLAADGSGKAGEVQGTPLANGAAPGSAAGAADAAGEPSQNGVAAGGGGGGGAGGVDGSGRSEAEAEGGGLPPAVDAGGAAGGLLQHGGAAMHVQHLGALQHA